MILRGNCLDTLKTLADCSIDSIVTDPPYELGFMGKSWDASGIAYNVELWRECLRVLKPGGHLLAFSGSRTYHRMTVAIEDAGFEIRDQIMWLYGSGFPKSLNVSKAIDKAAGLLEHEASAFTVAGRTDKNLPSTVTKGYEPPKPQSSEAQRWQGWGTALKPAHEPICVARKPLTGNVASNVLEWGTGALNIDGSRVAHQSEADRASATPQGKVTSNLSAGSAPDVNDEGRKDVERPDTSLGRWPANVIHDGSNEVVAGFPTQAGAGGKASGPTWSGPSGSASRHQMKGMRDEEPKFYGDSGSAARFFYCAKASKSERNAGLEGLPERRESDIEKDDGVGGDNPRNRTNAPRQNFHPTVKPIALMRYLVKLVTPPGGTVLDPFLGSGSTAVAAIIEGFEWVGCEMTEDYWPIIEARVAWAEAQPRTLL